MSRIGKLPVIIPKGVTAAVQGQEVQITGPRGKLSYVATPRVAVALEGGNVVVKANISGREPQLKADFGTTRATINNMVKGVTEGWRKSLEMNGVGYNAKLAGQVLTLSVGFSHEVKIDIPKEVKCTVVKNTQIDLESSDRQIVGQIAALIRKVRPPEPYLGKGIKYSTETVRRKAGKTAKK